MKKLLISVALAASLLSCAKKEQNVATPPPAGSIACIGSSCSVKPPVPPTSDIIAADNWQFTLVGDGWVSIPPPDDTIKVVFTNSALSTVVFFVKDPTKQPSSEYIINALRSFKAAGTTIQSAKQLTLNGNNFIMVVAQGESRRLWTWITVQKGNGYIFSCASNDDTDTTATQRCQDIADSLQIKL